MLDGLSLDQLRVFLAAVDDGSFSAAARRLHRAQSAVSEMVAKLEDQVGVALFDRAGRYPKLTAAGAVLLADARGVIAGVDTMRAKARGMAAGLEPELSVVVDVMFPLCELTFAARDFRLAFPHTPLRLFVEALGATFQLLLDRRASLGIVGSLPTNQPTLTIERLTGVSIVVVAAADHPLGRWPGTIPRTELARHVQLVLTDRSDLSSGRDFFVLTASTWRLSDLFAKHAFLLGGLGWGGMPRHVVEADIAAGRLIPLTIEDVPAEAIVLPMSAAYSTDRPPGPAGRWLIERLKADALRSQSTASIIT
jgi:DNA-binding transcriptional LysR family regulator